MIPETAWGAVLTVLTMVAGSSVVSSLITILVNRRQLAANVDRTKVEASKTLSDMAIAHTSAMATQIGELRGMLQVHREWDRRVVKVLRKHDIDIEDPPELWLG